MVVFEWLMMMLMLCGNELLLCSGLVWMFYVELGVGCYLLLMGGFGSIYFMEL